MSVSEVGFLVSAATTLCLDVLRAGGAILSFFLLAGAAGFALLDGLAGLVLLAYLVAASFVASEAREGDFSAEALLSANYTQY